MSANDQQYTPPPDLDKNPENTEGDPKTEPTTDTGDGTKDE